MLYHFNWYLVTYLGYNDYPPAITEVWINTLPLDMKKLPAADPELWQHIQDATANNFETHLSDLEEAA